jgi:hypothetical protein
LGASCPGIFGGRKELSIMAIISKQQLKQIDESLKVLAAAKVEINRAKSAGFDMAAKEQQLKELEEKLIRIKQVYSSAQ